MLVSTVLDDHKAIPEGPALTVADGVEIKKCRGMMYWLRWGEHTFDIRVMWSILGLNEEEYFSEFNHSAKHYTRNTDFHSSFIEAIKGKSFADLMIEHDAIC